MLSSRKSKIFLAIAVAVTAILAIILVFIFRKEQPAPSREATLVDEGSSTGLHILPSGLTPTPTAQKPDSATTAYDPYPNPTVRPRDSSGKIIGFFDWTRNQPKEHIKIDEEFEKQIAGKDICALAGIQDIWSNPFEKTLCGMAKFTTSQIIEPFSALACGVLGSNLALNYGDHIKARFVNGACLIEDRR